MDSIIPAIRDVLIKEVIKAVMTRLIASSAFFAMPIVNPVVVFIVTKLVTFLIDETALGLSLLWITINISYEVSSVEKATEALKKMIDNPKDYSNEQATAIEANFDSAARDLIRISIIKLR